ncbi:MAG: D-mannonate oxidoreductase [Ferruginibacter sp.]|nr:D-mannonate oxidoreductase [Ferruginibacter sp.]
MSTATDRFSLTGKTIVITGATGILGASFCMAVTAAGAQVAVLGRNGKRANERVEEIVANGGEAIAVLADVLDEGALLKAKEKIISCYGKIDGLVNAAGGNLPGAVVQPSQDIFDLNMQSMKEVMDLNLFGTLLPTQVFGEAIAANESGGSIVNISSVSAKLPLTKVLGYSMAKAAIESYTKWFAVEQAKRHGDKMRMNALVPGFFLTEQNRSLMTNTDGSYSERGASVMQHTPFKRFGQPDELSGALIWMLSDASKFVTGTTIVIDGGFTSFSGV